MAFPTTGILDDFNRANGALGANWTGPALGDANALTIVGNAASPPSNAFAASYWSAATFGPDCEVYITIVTRSNTTGLYWRITSPGIAGYSGYAINWTTSTITIYKVTAGSAVSIGTISQATNDGDSIGVSMVGSLITIYYKAGAGAWGSIGTVTDATFTGAGALALEADRTVGNFDNFGGGSIVTAGKAPPPNRRNIRNVLVAR